MAKGNNFKEQLLGLQKTAPERNRSPKAGSSDVYRLNLKLSGDLKEYLSEAAWRQRISITQLVNNVLEAYKEKNPLPEGDLK